MKKKQLTTCFALCCAGLTYYWNVAAVYSVY